MFYTKTYDTMDEAGIKINIPTDLNDITIGLLADMDNEQLTTFERLALISGLPVDSLYELVQVDIAELIIKEHGEGITLASMALKSIIPKKLKLVYNGRRVNFNASKNLAMEPAGAYYAATKIINNELNNSRLIYGDGWTDNFSPTVQSCINLLDQYLHRFVTENTYNDENLKKFQGTARQLPAGDALAIAQHFFRAFPKINGERKTPAFQIILDHTKAVFDRLINA